MLIRHENSALEQVKDLTISCKQRERISISLNIKFTR